MNTSNIIVDISMKLGLYKHYKGNLYQVLAIARHSEGNHAPLVIYQALYGDYRVWARPMEMFLECIIHEGQTISRFALVSETFSALPRIDKSR